MDIFNSLEMFYKNTCKKTIEDSSDIVECISKDLNIDLEYFSSGSSIILMEHEDKETLLCVTFDKRKRISYEAVGVKTFNFKSSSRSALLDTFELFLVEKLDKFNLYESNNIEEFKIFESACDIYESMFSAHVTSPLDSSELCFDFESNIELILEDYQIYANEEEIELYEKYLSTIESSVLSISRALPGEAVNIDLSEKQFVYKGSQLICIDPLYFI